MSLPSEFAALVVALVGGAAILDLRTRRVPNELVLLIAGLGVVAHLVVGPPARELGLALAGLAVGLALWIGPFALRWVGAADVKLVAAVGAWLGPLATFRMSLYAGIVGGLLSIGYLATGRHRAALSGLQAQLISFRVSQRFLPAGIAGGKSAARGMPYTVAVLVGLVVELFVIGEAI